MSTYIPAQPGWMIVTFINDVALDDHETQNWKIWEEEPIIAWAIVANLEHGRGEPVFLPVGCYSSNGNGVIRDIKQKDWAVRRPDGLIAHPHLDWVSAEEDLLNEDLPEFVMGKRQKVEIEILS